MSLPLLVVLLGPTASGKTALSMHVAERMQGEIVSCDSVAVYREFEIGTAKPSREERRRVPHHLIDIAGPEEAVTAGDYSRLARQAVREIAREGICRSLSAAPAFTCAPCWKGCLPGPPRSEELRARLRERAAERGPEYLHKLLRRLDPAAAQTIHANDVPKVVRALEVSISARRSDDRSLAERPRSTYGLQHSSHRLESGARSALPEASISARARCSLPAWWRKPDAG